MSERNVYQRLVEVCKDIGSQPWYKDQSNSQFESIPIDKMRGGVREACAKNGIVHVGPLNIAYHREPKGDKMMLYYGSCVFRYVNADKPDDYVEYESVGEAMDTGDKCMGKLVTNMIKNHYKAAFDIVKIVGHTDPAVTVRYIQTDNDRLRTVNDLIMYGRISEKPRRRDQKITSHTFDTHTHSHIQTPDKEESQ